MAVSGFEGFEKRLELRFTGDDPKTLRNGFRNLHFQSLEEILDAVQCTVVSAVGNRFFDSYVLSESSLFVYPTKIVIKTCGTTQLLKSVPLFLSHARQMGLTVVGCRYTRGNFIFPKSQLFPHTSFREEIVYLENNLPANLCFRKASIMPAPRSKKSKKSSSSAATSSSSAHSWHVYTASDGIDHDNMMAIHEDDMDDDGVVTVEVCMTELDKVLARKFFRRPGDENCGEVVGNEMTEIAGIRNINPKSIICDFGFDPCGYSMNGIDGENYSTIHVTPEDGYSYASFECIGLSAYRADIGNTLRKVVQVFRPSTMSVSITSSSSSNATKSSSQDLLWRYVSDSVESLGLNCTTSSFDKFPGFGSVVFQTFTTKSRK